MNHKLEITEAEYASELRSGVLFKVRNEHNKIVCSGRIKPSGKLFFSQGSQPFPTKAIDREVRAMARRYGEAGTKPTSIVFEVQETLEPAPAPQLAEATDSAEPEAAPKPRRRKAAKND